MHSHTIVALDPFQALPLEILLNITSFLDINDTANFFSVNSLLYSLDTNYFWEQQYRQYFPILYRRFINRNEITQIENWKNQFAKAYVCYREDRNDYNQKLANLSIRQKQLLGLVTAGDINGLKQIGVEAFEIIKPQFLQNFYSSFANTNPYTIFNEIELAIFIEDQDMLNYFYELLTMLSEKRYILLKLIADHIDTFNNLHTSEDVMILLDRIIPPDIKYLATIKQLLNDIEKIKDIETIKNIIKIVIKDAPKKNIFQLSIALLCRQSYVEIQRVMDSQERFIKEDGHYLLHRAIDNRDIKIVRLFLENQEDFILTNSEPLLLAIANGDDDIVNELLHYICKYGNDFLFSNSVFHKAASINGNIFFRWLEEHNPQILVDGLISTYTQLTPFTHAIKQGHFDLAMKLMIFSKAWYQNVKPFLFADLIHVLTEVTSAIRFNRDSDWDEEKLIAYIRFLLRQKINLNQFIASKAYKIDNKWQGTRAIHFALRFPSIQIAQVLLEEGKVDINVPALNGGYSEKNWKELANWEQFSTPLCLAMNKENIDMVQLVLQHDVDLDLPCSFHRNALHAAMCVDKCEEIIPLLLKHGAKVTKKDVSRAQEINENIVPLLKPHISESSTKRSFSQNFVSFFANNSSVQTQPQVDLSETRLLKRARKES